MAAITWLIRGIRQALNVIPKKYNLEIRNEMISKNINRIGPLSIMLIVINILLIFMDFVVYLPKGEFYRIHATHLAAHIFVVVERSLCLAFIYIIAAKKPEFFNRIKEYLIWYSCFIALIWCSYLSVSAQEIFGQNSAFSAYIIGNFAVASAILLIPLHGLILFSLNCSIFILVLYFQQMSNMSFIGNVINIFFVLIFSFVISYLNISLFSKDYINRKTIQQQSHQINNSRDKLEETVRVRTEELIRANEELIKEMGIRHEVEMQAIRTRLMYEENAMLLSEIKEYEELRNVFFANLSHELRTPLNVIFSAQQMMNLIISKQNCGSCKDQISKYNRIVKQNCYRLIRLIGNLIDITKIDAKYFEISKKNCDIIRVVENITQSVADYIKDKDIDLSFDTELEEKVIACDPDKVERIMLNLLSNAVKFTPQYGKIQVNVKQMPRHVAISIKDTGIGISKEMQQMVFERFIQADKSMTRNREGSGIGLSLVKSLVDLHQGNIYINSELGAGSEFVVELPDEAIPFEDCVACSSDDNGQNIERIHIEFSDIYS